jgi:hypothetical protein
MLNLRKGSSVQNQDQLSEGYQLDRAHVIANVGAEKILDLLHRFIDMYDEPMFFILELHTNLENETENPQGQILNFHNDVYYIDGCSKEDTLMILNRVGEILINDGICSFGFGCHFTKDEVMIGKYNVVLIYSSDVQKFSTFFEQLQIPQVEHLITASSTFTKDQPGTSISVKTEGKDAYDIPEILTDMGIYFSEKRVG